MMDNGLNLDNRGRNLEKYYKEKANVRLKYAALITIGAAIILIVATISLINIISAALLLFIRGCIGLLAIIFVVLVAILLYRVNNAYHKDKYNHKF